MELADSSLEYDRTRKLAAYASAGIQDYWIINLRQDQIEIYRKPHGERYQEAQIARIGDWVTPLAKEALSIEVADLLGKRCYCRPTS